jgi:hypothetical protein
MNSRLRRAVRERAKERCEYCQISEEDVRLFNPRIDQWDQHFRWEGATLVSVTDIGTVTPCPWY